MLIAMTPLLTIGTLSIITRTDIELGDPFATWVINGASMVVADAAEHEDWLDEIDGAPIVPAPARAILIAENLAKRTYLNPNSVIAEGSIGPIGGDRYVEDFARAFELTAYEREVLGALAGGSSSSVGGLWTQATENRPGLDVDPTIYLPDLDERAGSWPVGTDGVDNYAYEA
jgi:hypothetical protein